MSRVTVRMLVLMASLVWLLELNAAARQGSSPEDAKSPAASQKTSAPASSSANMAKAKTGGMRAEACPRECPHPGDKAALKDIDVDDTSPKHPPACILVGNQDAVRWFSSSKKEFKIKDIKRGGSHAAPFHRAFPNPSDPYATQVNSGAAKSSAAPRQAGMCYRYDSLIKFKKSKAIDPHIYIGG